MKTGVQVEPSYDFHLSIGNKKFAMESSPTKVSKGFRNGQFRIPDSILSVKKDIIIHNVAGDKEAVEI
jgi:hypothetical protein